MQEKNGSPRPLNPFISKTEQNALKKRNRGISKNSNYVLEI